ncbi:cellobiose dehydrogenase [Pyronema domesticum]|nr:cellobiose dehydrogenase [Pyronema domesticum]
MLWLSPLLAFTTLLGLVSAQSSNAFTDSKTGIQYQQYYTPSAGGYSFSISLPLSPTNEFIGRLVGPVTGWSGVSFGGGMTNSLLFVSWVNNGEIIHGFRTIDSYVDPLPYTGAATATEMYKNVNTTHFELTFRCQNCTSWGTGSFDPTGDFSVMGWAISLDTITDPSNKDSVIPYHNNGMGQYGMVLASAKFSQYQTWLDAAPKPTTTAVPTSTTTTTTTGPTAIPTSTTILGTADYLVIGGGAGGLVAADKLSESGASVILIERGPPATYAHGGRIFPSWLSGKSLTRFDVPGLCNEIWHNSTGISCDDVDRMQGCVLGGGTAVNAGMFYYPPDRDWDYNFPTGWKAADIVAAKGRMFSRIPPTDHPGNDGKRYVQETYDVLGPALKKAGWSEVTVNSVPNQKNKTFGHSPFMFSNGERGGPLATYLVTAKKRSNFKLVMNTMVRRIRRDGSVATGIEVYATTADGKTGIYKLNPGGRIILSAGTFGTAKILFRSAIGPKDMLDVVKSSQLDGPSMLNSTWWILSPVGYNILDHTNTDLVVSHPNVKAYDYYGAYDSPIPADRDNYLNSRSGPLSTAAPGIPMVLYDQITGSDGIVRQIQWTARAEGSLGETGNTLVTISQYLGTGITSRGRIAIKSNLGMTVSVDPWANTAEDKAAIVKGIDNILTALRGWGGNANGTITVLQPGKGLTAQQYVDAYVQGRTANHWLGSAKMGTDDGTKLGGTSGSVVDTNVRVYGTANIVSDLCRGEAED